MPPTVWLAGGMHWPLALQVDGGVSEANVRSARDAGATLLVAASAIFGHDDLAAAYERLVQAVA